VEHKRSAVPPRAGGGCSANTREANRPEVGIARVCVIGAGWWVTYQATSAGYKGRQIATSTEIGLHRFAFHVRVREQNLSVPCASTRCLPHTRMSRVSAVRSFGRKLACHR
jgi:hypothetical protein